MQYIHDRGMSIGSMTVSMEKKLKHFFLSLNGGVVEEIVRNRYGSLFSRVIFLYGLRWINVPIMRF
jgi:hypothetical protein